MNRLLKFMLIMLGLGLVGYAVYFKELAVQSPRSAWESSLLNAARRSDGEFSSLFNRIMDGVGSGWNWVIIAGVAVVVLACFIKAGPGDRKQ